MIEICINKFIYCEKYYRGVENPNFYSDIPCKRPKSLEMTKALVIFCVTISTYMNGNNIFLSGHVIYLLFILLRIICHFFTIFLWLCWYVSNTFLKQIKNVSRRWCVKFVCIIILIIIDTYRLFHHNFEFRSFLTSCSVKIKAKNFSVISLLFFHPDWSYDFICSRNGGNV